MILPSPADFAALARRVRFARFAAGATGIWLVLMPGAPASGQVCSTYCWRYDQGNCVEYHQSCTTGPGSSGPVASYGAIAYGRTSGAWGDSYRWGSRAKAESVAKQNCDQHGDDCEVMVWFERKCGAVISGANATAYWGLGDSDRAARAQATQKCVADGGGDSCEVQVSRCSR